jgi:hypothetical protein
MASQTRKIQEGCSRKVEGKPKLRRPNETAVRVILFLRVLRGGGASASSFPSLFPGGPNCKTLLTASVIPALGGSI